MRIWSLHPQHLDAKGLVALWRETLLALHVLEGRTKGYTRHPQLTRFRNVEQPVQAINYYLHIIAEEASRRGYNFDKSKVSWNGTPLLMPVTSGQITFEKEHLLRKLEIRDPKKAVELVAFQSPLLHPLFFETEGDIEPWEII